MALELLDVVPNSVLPSKIHDMGYFCPPAFRTALVEVEKGMGSCKYLSVSQLGQSTFPAYIFKCSGRVLVNRAGKSCTGLVTKLAVLAVPDGAGA